MFLKYKPRTQKVKTFYQQSKKKPGSLTASKGFPLEIGYQLETHKDSDSDLHL